MANHEYTPPSRGRKKADPKHIQKIIEGGKKADKIREHAENLHHEVDVPKAEKELEKALKELHKNDQ